MPALEDAPLLFFGLPNDLSQSSMEFHPLPVLPTDLVNYLSCPRIIAEPKSEHLPLDSGYNSPEPVDPWLQSLKLEAPSRVILSTAITD